MVFDKNQGVHRPSSSAFNDHPGGTPMSVVLGKDATAKGRTGKAALEMFPGYSLASITAGQARASEQIIYRAPAADEPDHGEVKGEKPKAVQRGFAKQAKWVVLVIPS